MATKKTGRPTGRKTSTPKTSGYDRNEAGRNEPTLTRTKSLLLAALRVWELKHRIED